MPVTVIDKDIGFKVQVPVSVESLVIGSEAMPQTGSILRGCDLDSLTEQQLFTAGIQNVRRKLHVRKPDGTARMHGMIGHE